jgi:sugar O-acyltransferase (sialic acid O-acetyltransferase NeuD family)
MKGIILIGAGGHCKSCIDIIEMIEGYHVAGIIERKGSTVKEVLGYSVIGNDEDLADLRKKYDFAFVTVGQIRSSELKVNLFDQLKNLTFEQPSLVSPLAHVSKHATVGVGTIIMHHALVNAAVKIGENCIINSKVLIEHDTVINDHCHISTGAIVNGSVIVGEKTFIGSNATIKHGVSISSQSFIKAGSLLK